MTFSLFKKKKENKYDKAEYDAFVKESKHHPITKSEYIVETERQQFDIPKIEHERKTVVNYKGKQAVVTKATPDGVYVRFFKPSKKDEIAGLSEPIFIKEKDYREHARLSYTPLPFLEL